MTAPCLSTGATISVAPNGEAFACEPGQTLLFAGLIAGLDLPYECASGGCGSCRCKLISGQVTSLWPESPGLSDRDRRRGDVILMCQAVPQTSCVIDARIGEGQAGPRPASGSGRVMERLNLTRDMVKLTLADVTLPDALPGQFVLVDLPEIGRRAYSIANSEPSARRIDLIIKIKPEGATSEFLARQILIGETVAVYGPLGRAYLREDSDRPVVCIAGGSGLGPMWSIAQAAAHDDNRAVHLYFGVNTPDDCCFTDEFAALSASFSNVRTTIAVASGAAEGCRTGLVGDVVSADLPDLTGADVYMAGPPPMIDAILNRFAAEQSISFDRLFFDRFY